MIIDDSVTIAVAVTDTASTTLTDVIDRQAAGTCFTRKPTFVLNLAAGATAGGTTDALEDTVGGSFTLMTCDTEDGTFTPVETVYIPAGKLSAGPGVVAKIDMPMENVKRFITFKIETDSAASFAGEILTVTDAARGM